MRTAKTVFFQLTFICLAALFSLEAKAAWNWHPAAVDRVGPVGLVEGVSGSSIYLTSTSSRPRWAGSKEFTISPSRGKEYLQTGTDALISNRQVIIYTDPDLENPLIKGMLIHK